MYTAAKANPVLSVRDVSQAIGEYARYGFSLQESFGQPPVHAIIVNAGAELHLSSGGAVGNQTAWIVVDDLDQVDELLKSALSGHRLEAIRQMPHGYRELSVKDTSGNILTFAQRLG